jgi:hypothetical protein
MMFFFTIIKIRQIILLFLSVFSVVVVINVNNINVVVDARATHITSPTGLGLLGVVHTDRSRSKRRSSIFMNGGDKSMTTSTNKPRRSNKPPSYLYRWGNLGNNSIIKETLKQKIIRFIKFTRRNINNWIEINIIEEIKNHLNIINIIKFLIRILRIWIFYFFSKDCMESIYEDKWHAERDPEDFFSNGGMWISKGSHKEVVRRRMNRSKRNRQWVGLGYTPRLVWLIGVLLRGTFSCTAIDKVFNPSLTSWGAGTVLGAKCTHQEWISSFMLGWYGSYYYWKLLFGCNGPPGIKNGNFEGIPISISKIRIFGKVKE